MPSNLRTERDGDVLRITLARPDRRNAFDAALIAELAEAFVGVGRARAVVLAGDGPSFSAGADVDWMRSSVDVSYEENVADANALRAMLEAIDGCPAPVVARVQGHALGGGAGLVACCDVAVERVVGELLSAGPQAARWAKRLVRERPDGPETARWIAERRTSDEGQEGMRAFLEKRPPSWRG